MKDIILTGPKHCGKTTLGKVFASLYSCEFIDIDELILQRTGKTARELFNEGQAVFQKAEAEAVASFADGDRAKRRVIATGGGMIDNDLALSALKKMGAIIVFLALSAETAWDRIAAGGELPPFLKTENPKETHRVLHERRSAAYFKIADIVIQTEGKTPKEKADEIFSHLDKVKCRLP